VNGLAPTSLAELEAFVIGHVCGIGPNSHVSRAQRVPDSHASVAQNDPLVARIERTSKFRNETRLLDV
jgi:hypothetical protein